MSISHLTASLALALGLSVVAACGPATPDPVTPDPNAAAAKPADSSAPAAPATAAAPATNVPAPTSAPAATPAPPISFHDMSNEQKIQHMKTTVMPQMSTVFQAADAKRYADFGCKTCHGEKKQDPHVVLPVLKLSGDGYKKLSASKPAVMKFMSEQVTPAMATAMREKPWDPATQKGFGCGGCHKVN